MCKEVDCCDNSQRKRLASMPTMTAFAQTPEGTQPDQTPEAKEQVSDSRSASYGFAESIEEAKENLEKAQNDAAVSKDKLNTAKQPKMRAKKILILPIKKRSLQRLQKIRL